MSEHDVDALQLTHVVEPSYLDAVRDIRHLADRYTLGDSRMLRLCLIYEHFLNLLDVSAVHLTTEERTYPRQGAYRPENMHDDIRAGKRYFGPGRHPPLVQIYGNHWRIVRMAYAKAKKGRWLLLQYHGGASFSMLDLDLHASDHYDLSTPDDIQRSRAAFDEETELVLEGLESHGIDRSNMIVSNSPGNIYCDQRVTGRYLWIKHEPVGHQRGKAMWEAFRQQTGLHFETNFNSPSRIIRIYGQPYMELLVQYPDKPLGKQWRISEPGFPELYQQANFRFERWAKLPEVKLKATLGKLLATPEADESTTSAVMAAPASRGATWRRTPTKRLPSSIPTGDPNDLAKKLLEEFTAEDIDNFQHNLDTWEVSDEIAGRTYSPLTYSIVADKISLDVAIEAMYLLFQRIRPSTSRTRSEREFHRRWFQKFIETFDPDKAAHRKTPDEERFDYMLEVTPEQLTRYAQKHYGLDDLNTQYLREVLETLYLYEGRVAAKTLYMIVGPSATNKYYWNRFTKHLPDFLVILVEYDEDKKLCRQSGVEPRIVQKVKLDPGS